MTKQECTVKITNKGIFLCICYVQDTAFMMFLAYITKKEKNNNYIHYKKISLWTKNANFTTPK